MPTATLKNNRPSRYQGGYTRDADIDYDDPTVRAELDGHLTAPEPTIKPDNIDPDTNKPDPSLNAEESTYKKRYGDLRRYQQEQKAEFDTRLKALEKQLTEATKKELVLPKTEAEMQAWKDQYPDVYDIVETIATKKVLAERESLNPRIAEIEAMRRDVEKEKAENKIRAKHPDFDDLRSDENFHQWVAGKAKWVQDALYVNEDDPRAVIDVLDFYKQELAAKAPKIEPKRVPSDDARRAAQVVTRPVRSEPTRDASAQDGEKIYESDVKKMSSRAYEKNEDAIEAAMRSGRFIYDVSGGAR